MEKKSKFQNQPSGNKGVTTDPKKNQDASNKTFPKSSRKREPSGSNGFSKSEQFRKAPGMAKTRSFDKRPKPKGQYYGSSKADPKVDYETDEAELGSVMVPGSKKQNLNHLLNFHYEPREAQGSSGGWSYARSFKTNGNRWLPPVQRHKYNKEQFLQANCQFVVNINGDYSPYLVDPDILVDWKMVEQIKLHTCEKLACPICLSPPVAGRMTRCGHVYCWPCILHYLSLSDKSWRKCPICYESIHKYDLKSFVEIPQNPFNIGDIINLRLMKRKRGSLIAIPVDQIDIKDPDNFLTISQHSNSNIFSKLLLANVTDVLDIIDIEKNHLQFELLEDPNSPESCFIEQALNELLERETKVLNQIQIKKEADELLMNDVDKKKETVDLMDKDDDKKLVEENNPMDDPISNPQNLPKYFYFYQAEDGQHVYLHVMNVKMLELQYGSLENCPRVITGKLLERESGSCTEDLRKRLRYLCHLPVTCSFDIVEIELTAPIISTEVMVHFQEQVNTREKKRQRREREEKKREKKILAEENKRMGKISTPKVHLESHKHFPQWQPEPSSGIGIPTPPESAASSSIASSPAQSTFEEEIQSVKDFNGLKSTCSDQGPSFAQMLQNKSSRMTSSATWPSVSRQQPVETSKGAWSLPINHFDDDNNEDYSTCPTYNQSFGDVLAQALEQTEILDTVKQDDAKSGKNKKKKRGKPTVLFATTMNRAS